LEIINFVSILKEVLMSEDINIVDKNDLNEPVRRLVDIDTGEIVTVSHVVEINEGDILRIVSAKQQAAIKKNTKENELNKDLQSWNNELGGFVFVLFKYCNSMMQQHEDLIPEDITKLFYLATFVDYSGVLIYDNRPMDRDIMQSKLDMSREKFTNFFNKLKNLKILSQDEDKNIVINKSYFFKGDIDKEIKKNMDYTRVYIKTIRYLYENVPQRKQGRLGNYFKLIPYIHRQRNVLCKNPDELKEKVNLLHVRELQEILGYTRDSVRSFIREMLSVRLENGEAILGFFRTEYDEGKSYVIVNPKVFYGGNFNLKDGRNEIIKWFSN
jgi:hypothetical protein